MIRLSCSLISGIEAEAEKLTQAFLAGSGSGNSLKKLLPLLLPASASMYFEALSRDMELILLILLEKYIFKLNFEGCFENNCQIW